MLNADIPDPFSNDSLLSPPSRSKAAKSVKAAKPAKAATFDEWLLTPEGKKTAQLMPLLEVLSQGHGVRSQLAFNVRLQTAFEAGQRA